MLLTVLLNFLLLHTPEAQEDEDDCLNIVIVGSESRKMSLNCKACHDDGDDSKDGRQPDEEVFFLARSAPGLLPFVPLVSPGIGPVVINYQTTWKIKKN